MRAAVDTATTEGTGMHVSDHALVPALRDVLDARGSNLAQARTLFNASEQCDSLIEEVQALRVDPVTRRRILRYCLDLLALNTDEGEHERQAAGVLDASIAALRSAATNDGDVSPFTVKSIAAKLRPGLRKLAERDHDQHDGVDYFLVCCQVKDLLDQVPAHQLLAPSVKNALNGSRPRTTGGPYELLERIVNAYTNARQAA